MSNTPLPPMSEDEFRNEVISFIKDNNLKANTNNIVIVSTTTKNLPLSA